MTRVLTTARTLALTASLCLAACGSGGGDGSSFEINTTDSAAVPSAPLVVAGDWLIYFASEGFSGPAGTDFNGDGDTLDQVAVAVNLASGVETNLGVAARGATALGSEVFLAVDEADGNTDFDTGPATKVLLHWNALVGVEFVDELLDVARPLLPTNGRLYYASAATPAGDETNLRTLTAAAPTTPVVIENEIGGGTLVAELLEQQAGLLFCKLDESDNGADQNGDGDTNDDHVLALLDTTDAAGRLKSTALAMADDDAPLAADLIAAGDWLVAFLVDETAQDGTNFNDQTLFAQPLLTENCGVSDADALDQVLFFLEYADFLSGAAQPVNTGLAGHDRVLAFDGFVATISDESEASCNLNAATGDADTSDHVARWVEAVLPISPARLSAQMHALATATPGGSFGLSVLSDRLIAVVDEDADSSNLDGKVLEHELVGWLDPSVSTPAWDFSHQSSTRSHGTGIFDSDGDSEPFAGTSWMAAEAVGGRLGLVFLEEVPGTNTNVGSLNTNVNCAPVAKDSDKTDGLPVWADFESGPTLDFDGMGYAVDKANAGIELVDNFAFFRVSESDDNRDYNADGQINDIVLFRNPLTTCGPVPMATSSLVAGQAIETDGVRGAAFLSSETQADVDFNGDGDKTDLVARWFKL
ncbi:MAG: hypothetical protein ABL998_16870 [Planctomycetota bacterium]